MPIYEYQCQNCGAELEKRQSVTDEPLKIHEECGGELVKKISLSGFQFKGAGWYVTDYAGKNGKSAEKAADKPSEKTSGGESTTSADTASKSGSDTTTAKPDPASSKE